MPPLLLDQDARDRFIQGWTRHFSVIAPAGVGKTRALVERIVHIAGSAEAVSVLPRLVVVTYSVRAAQEMQLRARAAIQTTHLPFRVKRAFEQVFFGTIHSYCLRILQRYGDRLGLTSRWSLLDDSKKEELWTRFLNSAEFHSLSEPLKQREVIFRFIKVQSIFSFAQRISAGPIPEFCEMPKRSLKRLENYEFNGHAMTKKSLEACKKRLKEWKDNLVDRRGWCPLMPIPHFKAPEFIQLWREAFDPLIAALGVNVLGYARVLANGFLEYRLQRGVLTYEDQVSQASAVLDLAEVQQHLQEEPPIILLDEAQDTDAEQFQVLMKAAGWHLPEGSSPQQTLSIVGDFQQSIYSRADSQKYQEVHLEIIRHERGSESIFQVTFRCDEAIISFVNALFPHILNGANGQCAFTPLLARPNAREGQVYRWVCPSVPPEEADKNPHTAHYIAKNLALHLKEVGLRGLRADSWQQVAILCPRVSWLQELADAFVQAGLPVQVHSSRKERADRPAHRWLCALLWVISHPEDSFEVTGILREIFGYSDHDIALYTEGHGDRLRLDLDHSFKLPNRSPATLSIAATIEALRKLSLELLKLPLHHAVRELLIKVQLRERLASLDIDAERDMEALLEQVFARSSAGATLHEMAVELKDALYTAADLDDEIQNAAQFMTSYKAKGLEWQAVVLPYLFRGISFREEAYPRLEKDESGRETVVLQAPAKPFVDHNVSPGPLSPSEMLEKQSIERLLYVAATRAKHTLVLVDDEAVWAASPGKRNSDWTSGELLSVVADGWNRELWLSLPTEPKAPDVMPKVTPPLRSRFREQQEELLFRDNDPPIDKLKPLGWADIAPAVSKARAIPTRVTPHSLARFPSEPGDYEPSEQLIPPMEETEPPPVAQPEPTRPDQPSSPEATQYGLWWHDTAQLCPWGNGAEAAQVTWLVALRSCSQPDRGQEEAALFLASPLFQWLTEPGRLSRAECPFLWPENPQQWVEGIIDLIAFEPEEGVWHVIDWKTNRNPDPALLAAQYHQQIEAYCKALQTIFRAPVVGSLYLTGSGQWIQLLKL